MRLKTCCLFMLFVICAFPLAARGQDVIDCAPGSCPQEEPYCKKMAATGECASWDVRTICGPCDQKLVSSDLEDGEEENAATYEPGDDNAENPPESAPARPFDVNKKGVAITPDNNGFRTPEVAKKEEESDMQRKSLEANP